MSALVAPVALAGVLLVSAPTMNYAAPCENGEHRGNPHCVSEGPLPTATPELDSLVLFGAGALGLAAFAWRQRGKLDPPSTR
jgi:hypothetical protein